MGAGARGAGGKSDLSPTEATPRTITAGLADTRSFALHPPRGELAVGRVTEAMIWYVTADREACGSSVGGSWSSPRTRIPERFMDVLRPLVARLFLVRHIRPRGADGCRDETSQTLQRSL
jgi:hypothetical protein